MRKWRSREDLRAGLVPFSLLALKLHINTTQYLLDDAIH